MRDARAGYVQSLDVLRAAKAEGVYTKSSLMLGLGETDDEVIDAMLDLRAAGGRPSAWRTACFSLVRGVLFAGDQWERHMHCSVVDRGEAVPLPCAPSGTAGQPLRLRGSLRLGWRARAQASTS